MASKITTFRQAVQDELATDLGVTFHAGAPVFSGPIQEANTGFCWADGVTQLDPASEQDITVRARVYRRFVEPQGFDDLNPAGLEEMAEAIQAALADKIATPGTFGVWLIQVAAVEIDHETQSVTATVVGRLANQAGY